MRCDNGQAPGVDGNDAARAAYIPVLAFAGNTVRIGHFNLPQAPRDRVIGVIQMQIAPDALFSQRCGVKLLQMIQQRMAICRSDHGRTA